MGQEIDAEDVREEEVGWEVEVEELELEEVVGAGAELSELSCELFFFGCCLWYKKLRRVDGRSYPGPPLSLVTEFTNTVDKKWHT